MMQGNTLVAQAVPDTIRPVVYGELIGCMMDAESNGGINNYNPKDTDGLPAYGCLQFKKNTFKSFCVDTYYLQNDIWNCSVQIACADRMIQDGYYGLWGKRTRNICPTY